MSKAAAADKTGLGVLEIGMPRAASGRAQAARK